MVALFTDVTLQSRSCVGESLTMRRPQLQTDDAELSSKMGPSAKHISVIGQNHRAPTSK